LSSSSFDVSLKINLACSNGFDNSVHWKSGNNVEWSVNVETEIFTESILWYWFSFIKMNDLPSLVGTVVSIPGDYLSSFFVSS
jgi:hypothetical protein